MERIYTIPLRKAYRKPVTKRSNYSMSLIRAYLSRHMKTDLENVKLGSILNEHVWQRGIKYPPRKVKIKAVKDDNGIVKAELIGHDYKEFQVIKKQEDEGQKEKLMKRLGGKALKKQEEHDKAEGIEKVEVPEEDAKKETADKDTKKETPVEENKEETAKEDSIKKNTDNKKDTKKE